MTMAPAGRSSALFVPQSRLGKLIAPLAAVDALSALGWLLFTAAALAFWTQLQPFRTLQDYSSLIDPTQSNDLRKYTTIGFSALVMLLLWLDGRSAELLHAIRQPVILFCFGWFALTSLMSGSASLGLNRLVLAILTVQIAYAAPSLFRTAEGLIGALSVAAALIVVACFLGVVFLPEVSVHTARDVIEQRLAGDWRGIFGHKNDLSAMAALFIFLGIVLARLRSAVCGVALVIASVVLLLMSGGKTAVLLVVPAMAISYLLVAVRSQVLSLALAFGPLAVMLLFTVGASLSPEIGSLAQSLLPDPTFTGRSDAWRIALDAIAQSPWTGYGYFAFWDTKLAYGVASATSSAATFSHSHNGFLEVTLSGGFVGLLLVAAWTVVLPFIQIQMLKSRPLGTRDRHLLTFFVQVWLFCLLLACLEAILFNRSNPIWFTLLIVMGCLQSWHNSARQQRA